MNTGWAIARIVMMLGVVISSPALNGQDSLRFSDARLIQADTVFSSSTLAVHDLDGDGDLDVVIDLMPEFGMDYQFGAEYPRGLAFYSNDGNGGFRKAYQMDAPGNSYVYGNIEIGDINGDGRPDAGSILRDIDRDIYSLVVYEQNPEWRFNARTIMETSRPFNRLAFGDFDKDGDQDIATCNSSGNEVQFYFNDGSGNLTYAYTYETPGHSRILFADTDLDGDVDMVTSGASGVYWLENRDGEPGFESVNISVNTSHRVEAFGDMNNDGLPDILVKVEEGTSCFIQRTSGDAPFTMAPWMVATGIWSSLNKVIAADINNDGRNDLVMIYLNLTWFGVTGYELVWYEIQGNWYEYGGYIYGNLGIPPPSFLVAGDMNGDVRTDIAGVLQNRPIWMEQTATSWDYHDLAGTPMMCVVVDTEDVDQDGDLDLLNNCIPITYYYTISTKSSFTAWNRNVGEGEFDPREKLVDGLFNPLFFLQFSPIVMYTKLEDMDGDGIRDMVNLTQDSISAKIDLHTNDGNGHYGPPVTIGRLETAGEFTTGDLDGDGDTDVVAWREYPYWEDDYPDYGHGLVWYENLGGVFADAAYFADEKFYNSGFGIGRVNDDEFPDILQFSTNSFESDFAAINDGFQNFTVKNIRRDSISVTHILPQYHDMNNDGLLDVAGFGYYTDSLGNNTSRIAVFLNPGMDTIWVPQILYAHDSNKVINVSILDLDEDGNKDILFSFHRGSEIMWIRNLGNDTFSEAALLLEVESGLNAIVMADVDGDGRSDLIIGPDRHLRINWYRNLSGGEVTGIPEGASPGPTVKVYPNPASHEVLIRMDDAGTARYDLDLLDLSGRVIRSWKDLTGPFQTIPLHGMSAGVYIIRGLSANGGAFSVRVVKM